MPRASPRNRSQAGVFSFRVFPSLGNRRSLRSSGLFQRKSVIVLFVKQVEEGFELNVAWDRVQKSAVSSEEEIAFVDEQPAVRSNPQCGLVFADSTAGKGSRRFGILQRKTLWQVYLYDVIF